jgi:hypothetical protein
MKPPVKSAQLERLLGKESTSEGLSGGRVVQALSPHTSPAGSALFARKTAYIYISA